MSRILGPDDTIQQFRTRLIQFKGESMFNNDRQKCSEQEIVQAALDFAACETSQTDLEELRKSDSTSIPAEYLLLLERCDRFKRFLLKTHRTSKYVIR